MKKSRIVLFGALALLIVCLLSTIIAFIGYRGIRNRALNYRPLVLIHHPLNRQRVGIGLAHIIHATARATDGVSRIELWVDGDFISSQEAPDGDPTSPLVLSANWEPDVLGSHTLIVRATSSRGVDGQSVVSVEVVDTIVLSEEEVSSESDVSAPEPLPGGGDIDDEQAIGVGPPSDEAPPDFHDAPPGSTEDLLEVVDFVLPIPSDSDESNHMGLMIEALSLHSAASYDLFHCYIGFGDEPSRWYPDEDSDQSTDESFTSLGGGAWDIAAHLSGPRAVTVPWPGDRSIPIDITCIGLISGGAHAVEVGRVVLSPGPEAWDGVPRTAIGEAEGYFTLEYRISPVEGPPGWDFTALDIDMTPPTNLRVDFRRWNLLWDYEPQDDEEPIDGFRIYLNGNLQWVEPAEARASGIPPEWYYPPCGEQYSFYVDAFRGEDWSPPSNFVFTPLSEPGDPGCDRTIIVTFDTLTTRYMGGDQDHDDWVGPVYGNFYANDQIVSLDGRCYSGTVCGPVGLRHSSEYDISQLATNIGDGDAWVIVGIPPRESLVVGYRLQDQDSGTNDDDTICEGSDWLDEALDHAVESSIESTNFNCVVTFMTRPAFGSPVAGISGEPPRPLLIVENLTVDEETGQLQIHIHNIGAATWPEHDLEVSVTWPDGSGIGAYSFPDFFLSPGDRVTIQHPDLIPSPYPALGACVLLDPGNEIPEEDDLWPGERRGRYCRPLPDLAITHVNYDQENERLLVTIHNAGAGSIENRNLNMLIRLADDVTTYEAPDAWWSDVTMEPGDPYIMEWPNLRGTARDRLYEGYTVVIDPYNTIAEESGFNNEYSVIIPDGAPVRLSWGAVYVPHYQAYGHDETNSDAFDFRAQLSNNDTGRIFSYLADWSAGPSDNCRIQSGADYWAPGNRHGNCHTRSDEVEFYVNRDQSIEVNVSGSMQFVSDSPLGGGGLGTYSLGSELLSFGPDAWASAPPCSSQMEDYKHNVYVFPPEELFGSTWYTSVFLCRLEE
jgi:hypothetical protein